MADELEERIKAALNGLVSPERQALLRSRSEGRWYRAIQAFIFVVLLIGVPVLNTFVETRYGTVIAIVHVLLLLLLSVLLIPPLVRWRNQPIGGRMMGYLKRRNIRPYVCLNCEYDLKGSVADHCPECGTALAPVAVVDEDDGASPRC